MFLKSLIALMLISSWSHAADYSIFEVRKSLPMENNEPTFKDYYVNAGSESGIKKGMYINVVRSSSILDPAKNITQGTIKISLGRLQMIQVDKHVSVGRLYSQSSNEERPSVEFEGFMLGDVLDIESATLDAPAIKSKRKTAALDEETVKPVASAPAATPAVSVPTAPAPNPVVTAPAPVIAPAPAVAPAQQPEMVKQAVPQAQTSTEIPKKSENIL